MHRNRPSTTPHLALAIAVLEALLGVLFWMLMWAVRVTVQVILFGVGSVIGYRAIRRR